MPRGSFRKKQNMRRLAWAAGAFSAAIFAANYLLPGVWVLPCAILLLVMGGGLAALRRRWLRAMVISCFAATIGLGCFALHAHYTSAPAERLSGETRDFTAILLDYPEIYDEYSRAEVRLKAEGAPALHTLVYDRSGVLQNAKPGDELYGTARFSSAELRYGQRYDAYNARNIYLLANSNENLALRQNASRGFSALLARFSRALTDRVEAIFPEDTVAFFQALMLGEKGALYQDDALYVAMSRAGIMHIVAVSGMHVAFLVGLLQLLLGTNRRSSLLCIALVWMFVLVAGGSPSALRAAFMQTTLLLAPLLHRENDPPTSLLTALALLLLFNPRSAASISLQLSFASVAGLLLFSPQLYSWLSPKKGRGLFNRLLHYLAGSFAASISVLSFTLPLIAVYLGTVPLLSPLTNALVLWLVPLCFGGGYLCCLLSLVLPALGAFVAGLIAWPARLLLLIARLIASIPFATLYTSDQLVVYWLILCYLLAFIAAFWKKGGRLRWLLPFGTALVSLCLALTATRLYYASGTGTISVLDVGQGQSVAVFSGDSTVVVDCGNIFSAENAGELTGEYLLGRGRKQIDLLLLTHLHADHADGVLRLMELIPVRQILMPANPRDEDELLEPILSSAERHGAEVRYLSEDESMMIGTIRLTLFAPGEAGDANERCLTGLISLGDYDMLFTGDIDKAAEKDLIARHEIHDVELLIAGHHGSRYACSGELLASIGADTAVISVGYNTYGHPTYETLERLDAYGYTIYRTDLNGTVEIRIA